MLSISLDICLDIMSMLSAYKRRNLTSIFYLEAGFGWESVGKKPSVPERYIVYEKSKVI